MSRGKLGSKRQYHPAHLFQLSCLNVSGLGGYRTTLEIGRVCNLAIIPITILPPWHVVKVSDQTQKKPWFKKQSAKSSHPPRYSMVRQMAHYLASRRVCVLNDDHCQRVEHPPVGKQWVARFMKRHPELESTIISLIDAVRVKDTIAEALAH